MIRDILTAIRATLEFLAYLAAGLYLMLHR
jgi:hypothetical protein